MATERKTRAVGYAFQHIPTSPPVPIPYAHPTAARPLTPATRRDISLGKRLRRATLPDETKAIGKRTAKPR